MGIFGGFPRGNFFNWVISISGFYANQFAQGNCNRCVKHFYPDQRHSLELKPVIAHNSIEWQDVHEPGDRAAQLDVKSCYPQEVQLARQQPPA